ncbi:MAG: hypothetical protein EKE20_15390 [Candidatus Symbiopectobacterium sp. Dall1.0]|nr:hypothetical protein [Candidatus Symbiopectobacterium sp. Dall1.0]
MAMHEMPLSPDNQQFNYAVNGVSYHFRFIWRGTFWAIDISDSQGTLIIGGIPMITGADLLGQHVHLGLGFALLVLCDDPGQEYPTATDLGVGSHLYIITE